MIAIVALLVLGSMIMGLISLICLVRPSRRLRLPTRKAAGLALAGSFATFCVAIAITPSPSPEQQVARKADERAEEDREAAAKAQQDAKDKAADLAQAKGEKDAVLALWSATMSEAGTCDKSNTEAVNAATSLQTGRVSIYDAYRLAGKAQETCRSTSSALGELEAPSLSDESVESELNETLDRCRTAYAVRASALGKMQEVLDGNIRPSAVEEVRESNESAQAGVLACVAGFMSQGGKLGIELTEFTTSANN